MLVLQTIIKSTEKKINKPQQPVLPSEEEFKKFMKYDCKTDDPSLNYDIVDRIGEGGFAKVLKV